LEQQKLINSSDLGISSISRKFSLTKVTPYMVLHHTHAHNVPHTGL